VEDNKGKIVLPPVVTFTYKNHWREDTYRTLRIISAPNVPSESYNALSVSKNNTGIKK
jgi:hypothetical protein